MSQWRRKTHLDLKEHHSDIRGTMFSVTKSAQRIRLYFLSAGWLSDRSRHKHSWCLASQLGFVKILLPLTFLSLRWTPTSACYWCCWCSPNAGVWHSLRTLTSQHVQILSRLYDLSPVQNECDPKTIPWSVVWTLSMWRWDHLPSG